MIESLLLRWVLTGVFAAITVWCARVLLARPTRPAGRIDAACHVLMGLAMVAMTWPWGMTVPATPQVVLFGAACLWFASRVAFGAERGGAHAPRPRLAGTHHAVLMAGMAWMAVSMPGPLGAPGSGSGGHHHASGGGAALMSAVAADAATTALLVGHIVLGVVFVALCLPWLARAFDLGRRLPDPGAPRLGHVVADSTCHALMSFGMGVLFLALATATG
ncbi:hypothetical protein B1813_05325 [Saccharomonospora piscinae]|uniref:DUF5134 domain-containing protein n=1 Tax=Saccharomonospora piscinae TaxID=687388 RepID=A0A1V9AA78_SACPI|nr:DUF5134 domain-containing protein [Saccharomonospora piscinae]OQO93936.1 hypothetical protein B1813_05325 [Saccharomonospora piscinae]